MTSPDDLIRRGDAMEALPSGLPWGSTAHRIRALPAAPLPADVVDVLHKVVVSSCPVREAARILDRRVPGWRGPDNEPWTPDAPVPWVPSVGDRVDVADDARTIHGVITGAKGRRGVEVAYVNADRGFAVVLTPDLGRCCPRISDLSPAEPSRDEGPCCGGREFCPASCDCKCHRYVPESARDERPEPEVFAADDDIRIVKGANHDRDCEKCRDGDSCYDVPARDERPVDPIEVAARDLQAGDRIIDGDGSVVALSRVELDDRNERVHVAVSGVGWALDLDARVLVVRDRGTP